eukprot:TRINITY_DN23245_c0_g2_i1.p1 TRINITY_DN23245_c0_g2~~TRINITY_DN23245_c0_g2_i1.p1  ORF type:complete len:141 (+),score=26.83 TRINITY_DN23245_c0_g2_i1:76-498(+)
MPVVRLGETVTCALAHAPGKEGVTISTEANSEKDDASSCHHSEGDEMPPPCKSKDKGSNTHSSSNMTSFSLPTFKSLDTYMTCGSLPSVADSIVGELPTLQDELVIQTPLDFGSDADGTKSERLLMGAWRHRREHGLRAR